jgi:hypothetical protein
MSKRSTFARAARPFNFSAHWSTNLARLADPGFAAVVVALGGTFVAVGLAEHSRAWFTAGIVISVIAVALAGLAVSIRWPEAAERDKNRGADLARKIEQARGDNGELQAMMTGRPDAADPPDGSTPR